MCTAPLTAVRTESSCAADPGSLLTRQQVFDSTVDITISADRLPDVADARSRQRLLNGRHLQCCELT